MPRKAKFIDPLPDTMSGLIRVALKDLKRAEASPKYSINMSDWHAPTTDGKTCSVCYAGCVMAFSLKASPLAKVEPEQWWDGIADKLDAINDLREGNVSGAAFKLPGVDEQAATEFEEKYFADDDNFIPDYPYGTSRKAKKGREAFHLAQRKLANALAKAGL